MPDRPGPRLRLPQRALWVASVLVLGVAAFVVVAIRSPEASRGLELRPGERPPAACLSRARTVRVLQFNIHFGVSRSGTVDLGTIASEIRSARPDLVSLNEVDDGTERSGGADEATYLAETTGLHVAYGPNLPWDGGVFGNAILTRLPLVGSHNLDLPVLSGLEPRGLLNVTVRIGGRVVSFSSAHLSDGDDGRESRTLQAQRIATVLRTRSEPTIVAGDLNATPDEEPVTILRQHLLDAQELGGTGPGFTIPEQAPSHRFDYVLYDDHFAVVPGSTRVLPSASSDHRAVVTDLALLPAGCVG